MSFIEARIKLKSIHAMAAKKVLVAGVSGMIGKEVARSLASDGAQVIGTVRDLSKYQDLIQELDKRGIKVLEADVTKPSTLEQLKPLDIQVVVSCLQGDRSVIIDGQKRLFEVLTESGKLEKFMPSDFATDLFKIPRDDHPFLGARREFDEDYLWPLAKKHNVKICHVLNGCFMNNGFFFEGFCALDKKVPSLSYWGSPDQKYDLTTTDDSAKFAAKAALDVNSEMFLKVAGDSVSLNDIKKIAKEVRGIDLELKREGSVEDLRKRMLEGRAKNPDDIWSWVVDCYRLPMMNGTSKFDKIMNDKYPGVEATTVRKYLKEVDIFK